MSAVAPNTIVKFLRGVPLEATYENTAYWDTATKTKTDQATAFNGYVKPDMIDPTSGVQYSFILNNQSYQRYGRNQIKVQIPMDLLLDCNYLMFNNQRFGNKWFYAFITRLEYISEVVTLVSYEIDVLQTWAFDYTPNPCYIERCHSETDDPGDNLVEENLELGEYIWQQDSFTVPTGFDELDKIGYFICAPWIGTVTTDEQGDRKVTIEKDQRGIFVSGIFNGVYINAYDNLNDARAVIAEAARTLGDQSTAILAVYIAPYNAYKFGENYAMYLKNVTFDSGAYSDPDSATGTYFPFNAKLFTYPYRGILVQNANGESHIYRYEFFRNRITTPSAWNYNCEFEAICDPTPNGTVFMIPVNYKEGWIKGVDYPPESKAKITFNWRESMTSGSYSQLSFTTDSYTSYLAQSGVVQVLDGLGANVNTSTGLGGGTSILNVLGNALSSIVGGAVSAIAGNVAGGVIGGVGGVVSSLSENFKAQNMPNSTMGVSGSKQIPIDFKVGTFQFFNFRITKEYAQKLDNFFSLYGYADKSTKAPPRHNRKHWTYCKTQNCTINGSIPADDERKICDLYNAGIRWWVNLNEIGKYDTLIQDNLVLP